MGRDVSLGYRKFGNPVPRSAIHKLLRNRIYTGDFVWKGRTYTGSHEPLVEHDLWQRVQDLMDSRAKGSRRKRKHNFAFSGLISCGHCDQLLVGEIKKGRYIYYHCAGPNRTCPGPYVRQEVLEEGFAAVLITLECFVVAVVAGLAIAERWMDHSRARRGTPCAGADRGLLGAIGSTDCIAP